MKEGHVKCLCPSYKINDLNQFLTRGQGFTVTEDEAQRSSDLRRAERIRAVTIRWVERCREVKQPSNAPPYLRKLKKPVQVQPEPTSVEYVRVDQLKDALVEIFEDFRSELLQDIRGMVEQGRLLGSLPSEAPGPREDSIREEPSVFIPSNLVDKANRVDLSAAVTASETAGPDLDKTLGALKAAKK